ncbi:Z1 domain-containing protein [Azospira oryzae]|uniref:Z1 domain-containing protein n=1 Tax=Azospira oryzae TaxID=146939 RepID=A0ABY0IMG7_9RHOO|nr:Z1 domain-containing protein [Azospira oryzae]RZT76418.1 Z1 domain-containing protein [Azospira oryzae]
MATTIKILKTVKPPLRWIPEPKDFTTEFLESKSQDPNGPSIEDLRNGPNSVLQEALRILGRCLPPSEPAGRETGLVVGYVQSGKTMSFETVIALARDNGYGVVIVLAGTKNNLRDQSEDRLKKDLGIDEGGDHWYHLSNPTKAQRSQIESKIDAWRKKSSKKSLLITVLKHGGHIEKLTAVLQAVKLNGVPALIIDDESDQASLNTQASRIRKLRAPANAMSTTYEKILGLRDVLPHHSYLQYTATPQANLLLAQTDLLNPSFSELVTPGDAYTGGHAFFKSAVGLVEDIPPGDVPTPQHPLKSPPKSLLKALRYFLLVAAQHSLTRKKGLTSKDRNRSMMVHPAVATTQHKIYRDWVEKAFSALKRRIEADSVSKPGSLSAIFQTEYDALAKTYSELKPLSELIAALADEVLDDLNCVEVNGTPDAEKKVSWKATKYWILVGGAKLDRGYTVEGLCVTYMPRPLGTSAAADTLQQRARFFGYKKAYLGLCRVFIQPSVKDAFTEYVEHEDFVREALVQNRGKPLRDWRRDFILTQLLKPTRPNVVGLGIRRVLVEDWIVPNVLQRDDVAVAENRLLLDKVDKKWSKDFSRDNAATIPRLAPTKGKSSNDVILDVPLTTVLEDFLLNLEVKDPKDAEEHSAMLVALSALLAKDPSLKVDVFVMNQLKPGYRSRVGTSTLPASNKFAPINQYFSQSANAINDRSFFTPDRISLQLRRFNLGHHQRDESKADIHDVTWYALYVPKKLKKDLFVENRD